MSSFIYCDKCGCSVLDTVEGEPRIFIRLVNEGLWLCQVCIAKECERQFIELARYKEKMPCGHHPDKLIAGFGKHNKEFCMACEQEPK